MLFNKDRSYKLSFIIFLFSFIVVTQATTNNQHKPISNAGDNQFAKPYTVVKLNASNSTDIDGNKLSYHWEILTKPNKSQAKLTDGNIVSPKLNIDRPGVYQVELMVSDGKYQSTSLVEVNTEQTKPIIPKIYNQKVLTGEQTILSAEQVYDPDGDSLSYQWQLVRRPKNSIAQIQDATDVNAQIKTDQLGRYLIKLDVSDGITTKTQMMNVITVDNFTDKTLKQNGLNLKGINCIMDRIFLDGYENTGSGSSGSGNSQPVASIGEDRLGVLGQQIILDGSASFDIDLDSLSYQWSLLSSPASSTASIINPTNEIASITPDVMGDYVLQLVVDDGSCNSDPDSALVTISINQAPTINSTAITQATQAHNYSYQILANDPENHDLAYSLTIAPTGMSIDSFGLITWTAISVNTYTVAVLVTDEYGASTSQSYDVIVSENNAPIIQSWPISSGEVDFSYSYQLTTTDAEGDNINYSLTNPPTGMSINATTGLVTWMPAATGVFTIDVQADDGFGATDTQTFDLDIIELPPNPDDIAPPLSKTEYTPFPETISFLYENNPPVQIGMPIDTIQDYRVAVVTGKVLDEDNNPIQGIKVTINNHEEYGYTYTRDNGIFFMVVNGGGTVTVNLSKGGYLPVQRDVKTPWQEFAYVDDLIIVRLDDKVTSIDLTDASQPYQVAQGNVVTDIDGTRQATMLFPAGTTAVMTMPDGSTQNIDQLNVRATEYTVGENGPKKMPADLPTGSAYTYAVELSVDQAIDSNATRVDFSEEVIFYLDDFIGFPQGIAVPTGWYDKQKAYWIPSDNGLVIKIIDIVDGQAVIDVTADEVDNAATQILLDEIGIDDNELIKLAQMYASGKVLWRVPITHFTPWDCNWPYLPPEDIENPPENPVQEKEPEGDEKDNEEDKCPGCEIIAQDRTLKETMPVIGTSNKLKYSSKASKSFENIKIRLSGQTIPASLEKIELITLSRNPSLTGHYDFTPSPNLTVDLQWDGKDNWGRNVHTYDLQYFIIYTYSAIYSPGREQRERDFARIAQRGITITGYDRNKLKISTLATGTVELERGYSVLDFNGNQSKGAQSYLDGIKEEQLKLGGWGIENHHVYDPYRNTLYQGDGFIRKVAATGGYLGRIPFGYGHADPAIASSAGTPIAIAYAPNGDIYYTGQFTNNLGHNFIMIRKVTPDGTVFTVASTSNDIFCETTENQDAFNLCLTDIQTLFVNEKGEVFFGNITSDTFASLIRKIDINGLVTTVAGSTNPANYDDGILALDATLFRVEKIEFDKHGNLFYSDGRRIRKVDTNGVISTVAGNGGIDNIDHGVLATDTSLDSVTGFAIHDDGSIYLADYGHFCVRQITPDGYIHKYFDSSECSSGIGKGLGGFNDYPNKVELDKDGNLITQYNTLFNQQHVYFKKSYKFGMSEILNDNVNGFSGDGGAFSDAQFSGVNDFVYSDEDGFYIADTINNRIRRVTPADYTYTFAGNGAYDFNEGSKNSRTSPTKLLSAKQNKGEFDAFVFVASRDGSVIHKFLASGIHLKTIDSLTGKELVRFIYSNGQVLSGIVDANGLSTLIHRDENDKAISIESPYGKITTFEYHADGRLKKVTDPNNNHWNLDYTDGLLTSFNDRNDNQYTYTYENEFLKSDLNPIGGGWQLSSTYDEITKQSHTQMATGEGRISQFKKTKFDDKTVFLNTNPDGSTIKKEISPFQSTFTYPDGTIQVTQSTGTARLGNQVKFNQNNQTTTPAGKQRIVTSSLNESVVEEGSLAPVASSLRTTTINSQIWQSEYNQTFGTNSGFKSTTPEGRIQEVNLNSVFDVKSTQTTGFLPTEISYDANRRVENISIGVGVDKRETVLTYYSTGAMNGELHTITNAIGQTASFEYDNNGRISKQIMPDLREIIYSYDANGNLKSLTPPGRPVHNFDYNGMDQETQYTPPDLLAIPIEQTQYTYNLDKQITKITRPDGQEVSLNYNATSGKLENKVIPTGTYTYGYDVITGKLNQLTSPAGITLDYTFDGFLPLSTTWSGNQTGSVARTYDDLFRVTSRTINGIDTINYGYDNDNLLTSAGSMTINREAQKGGLINGTTLGNVTTTNSYSNFAELDNYNAQYSGADIYDVTYIRDKLGRITSKTETINATSTSYEYAYDLAGRLIEEKTNSVVTSTWDYDLNGNRTHVNGVLIATYDNQDRLLTYDGNSYTYTDNGELLTKTNGVDVTSYDYDVLGNLLSVTKPDGTLIEYLIDPRGRRVGKKVNGILIKGWLYKDKLNPIAELDANGNIVSRFIYGDRGNIPSYMVKAGVTYRVITNQLGSPLKIVDSASGIVAQEMSYDVWGNVLTDSNPDFQPFGFAGGIYDDDTKLTRFGFRDYDANSARWTSKDPIGFKGRIANIYDYNNGDPINFIDVTGLGGLCEALKKLRENPDNAFLNADDFYTDDIGTETNYILEAGLDIVVDGVDLQYLLTNYRLAESTGVFAEDAAGLLGMAGLSIYSIIGSAFTAADNGLSFDQYLAEVATDMKGITLGNEIAVNGDIDSYIAENCECQ